MQPKMRFVLEKNSVFKIEFCNNFYFSFNSYNNTDQVQYYRLVKAVKKMVMVAIR